MRNSPQKITCNLDLFYNGIIHTIIEDIHARYNTNQGSFMADELKVVKYEKENILKIIADYFLKNSL